MENSHTTLNKIISNKHILNNNNRKTLVAFFKNAPPVENDELMVFYTHGMYKDYTDENNILDMEIPLTDEYLDGLLEQHLNEYGGQHEGWDESIFLFKQLKKIRDDYEDGINKKKNAQQKFTEVMNDFEDELAIMPVGEKDLPDYYPAEVGSKFRKVRDEWEARNGITVKKGGRKNRIGYTRVKKRRSGRKTKGRKTKGRKTKGRKTKGRKTKGKKPKRRKSRKGGQQLNEKENEIKQNYLNKRLELMEEGKPWKLNPENKNLNKNMSLTSQSLNEMDIYNTYKRDQTNYDKAEQQGFTFGGKKV